MLGLGKKYKEEKRKIGRSLDHQQEFRFGESGQPPPVLTIASPWLGSRIHIKNEVVALDVASSSISCPFICSEIGACCSLAAHHLAWVHWCAASLLWTFWAWQRNQCQRWGSPKAWPHKRSLWMMRQSLQPFMVSALHWGCFSWWTPSIKHLQADPHQWHSCATFSHSLL